MRELLIATGNRGKFEEIRAMLCGLFERFYYLKDFEGFELEEDGRSYVENAMKKARKAGGRFRIRALADDSGLEVDFLSGRPGALSSRYGATDEERIERLLRELEGVPLERRGASFKAYIVYFDPFKERHHIFFGRLNGYIALKRKGGNGFGFDPVFYVPELGKTLAQLEREEKARISHRGKALKCLMDYLIFLRS